MNRSPLPPDAEAVIVGAGLAGAAAAYGLVRRGMTDLVILEREAVAGVHASGRNAAMAYRFIPQAAVRTLAHRGVAFHAQPPADFPLPLHNRLSGAITVLSARDRGRYEGLLTALAREGAPLEQWPAHTLAARVPALRLGPDDVGLFAPGEGVVDVDALLQGFLRAARRAGAHIRFRCPATRILRQGDAVVGVQTPEGRIRTPQVLLAAGPWVNDLARDLGLDPLPLRAARRHLAVLDSEACLVSPDTPLVWHQSESFYFRPESGGVLVCACDVTFTEPHDVGPDSHMVSWLAKRTVTMLRGSASSQVRRAWAGLRTVTPDEHFVVGPDPRLRGLFWVAGLGGHGMTTSPGVADLVGDLIVEGEAPWVDAAALAPERFLSGAPPPRWAVAERP